MDCQRTAGEEGTNLRIRNIPSLLVNVEVFKHVFKLLHVVKWLEDVQVRRGLGIFLHRNSVHGRLHLLDQMRTVPKEHDLLSYFRELNVNHVSASLILSVQYLSRHYYLSATEILISSSHLLFDLYDVEQIRHQRDEHVEHNDEDDEVVEAHQDDI